MHDVDGDGFISPKDITDWQTRFCSETSFLLSQDIYVLARHLKHKVVTSTTEGRTWRTILQEVESKHEHRQPHPQGVAKPQEPEVKPTKVFLDDLKNTYYGSDLSQSEEFDPMPDDGEKSEQDEEWKQQTNAVSQNIAAGTSAQHSNAIQNKKPWRATSQEKLQKDERAAEILETIK